MPKHILFLLSLLLPAVVVRGKKQWMPAIGFRAALIDVLKIVTAFTAAHSITLSLATLQVVSLPARISESAIAMSVVLAALNNLFPIVGGKRWLVRLPFLLPKVRPSRSTCFLVRAELTLRGMADSD